MGKTNRFFIISSINVIVLRFCLLNYTQCVLFLFFNSIHDSIVEPFLNYILSGKSRKVQESLGKFIKGKFTHGYKVMIWMHLPSQELLHNECTHRIYWRWIIPLSPHYLCSLPSSAIMICVKGYDWERIWERKKKIMVKQRRKKRFLSL